MHIEERQPGDRKALSQRINCETDAKQRDRSRMKHAARDLRMTSKPLIDVAMDAGYQNLGYFYRILGRHLGTTPRRCRLTRQATLRED